MQPKQIQSYWPCSLSGRLLKGGKSADSDIKSLEFIKLHYFKSSFLGEPCGTAIVKAILLPSLNIYPFIIHESKQFTSNLSESMNCRSRKMYHNCKSLQFLDHPKVKSSTKCLRCLLIKSDVNLFLCPETCSLNMTASRWRDGRNAKSAAGRLLTAISLQHTLKSECVCDGLYAELWGLMTICGFHFWWANCSDREQSQRRSTPLSQQQSVTEDRWQDRYAPEGAWLLDPRRPLLAVISFQRRRSIRSTSTFDLKRGLNVKGIVHSKWTFHPFFFYSPPCRWRLWWHCLIRITVLKFHRGKEFHPFHPSVVAKDSNVWKQEVAAACKVTSHGCEIYSGYFGKIYGVNVAVSRQFGQSSLLDTWMTLKYGDICFLLLLLLYVATVGAR